MTSADKAIGSHGAHCFNVQAGRSQGLAGLSTHCFSQDVFWEGRVGQPVVSCGATRQRGGARLLDVALLLQPSDLQQRPDWLSASIQHPIAGYQAEQAACLCAQVNLCLKCTLLDSALQLMPDLKS